MCSPSAYGLACLTSIFASRRSNTCFHLIIWRYNFLLQSSVQ
jgi:hypothetical protein